MNPKLPFLNKRYTLELQDSWIQQGGKIINASFEHYLEASKGELNKYFKINELNHYIFMMTELYCVEKYIFLSENYHQGINDKIK